MRISASLSLLLIALLLTPFSASAISPEEQLSDPILEERARDLSKQLRCLVCQNQSIDDSDADLAVDLRTEVRNQLRQGKNDADILEAIRSQYGDYVLLKPPVQKDTLFLWATPIILLILAILLFWLSRRGQTKKELQIDKDIEEINVVANGAALDVSETGSGRLPKTQLFGGIVLISLISLIAYSQLGRPDITAKPLIERKDELRTAETDLAKSRARADEALIEAKAKVAENPTSVDAQLLLALAAGQSGNFLLEQSALNTALELTGGNTSIKAMLAEALSREADGLITLRARQLIDDILEEAPEEPRALYLAGLAAFQDERYQAALSYWTQLQDLSTSDAPWAQMLSENIAQAARASGRAIPEDTNRNAGPNADILAAAADMSEADQKEMIRNMVASLEERLKDMPEDKEGWQRLIQSRRILNDRDGLIRALTNSASAFPTDSLVQLALLEELLQSDDGPAELQAAGVALSNLAAIDNESLEYLFFNGHFANLQGDKDLALQSWTLLRSKLPENTEFVDRLTRQIETLKSSQ